MRQPPLQQLCQRLSSLHANPLPDHLLHPQLKNMQQLSTNLTPRAYLYAKLSMTPKVYLQARKPNWQRSEKRPVHWKSVTLPLSMERSSIAQREWDSSFRFGDLSLGFDLSSCS
jgi:hypothetical protein